MLRITESKESNKTDEKDKKQLTPRAGLFYPKKIKLTQQLQNQFLLKRLKQVACHEQIQGKVVAQLRYEAIGGTTNSEVAIKFPTKEEIEATLLKHKKDPNYSLGKLSQLLSLPLQFYLQTLLQKEVTLNLPKPVFILLNNPALFKGLNKDVGYLLTMTHDELIKKIHVKNSQNQTALMLAAKEGRDEVVRYLINNSAKIDAVDKEGQTALMFAAQNGKLEVLENLLYNEANVNAASITGWTPLMYAALKGQTEAAKILIKKGASPQLINKAKCTAYEIAYQNEHVELVNLLAPYQPPRFTCSIL